MAEQFRKNGYDEYTIKRFIWKEIETDKFAKGEGSTDIE